LAWGELEALMKGIYGSSTGRPSYPSLTLLRSLLLGIWYRLSDEQLASCLARDLLFRKFCHLELGSCVPDGTACPREGGGRWGVSGPSLSAMICGSFCWAR
jgi:transposase, IS5 family